jgi:hypothetical protein
MLSSLYGVVVLRRQFCESAVVWNDLKLGAIKITSMGTKVPCIPGITKTMIAQNSNFLRGLSWLGPGHSWGSWQSISQKFVLATCLSLFVASIV